METEKQIERAAKLMKIIYLASHPGMDMVAIKLNCQPNFREMETAKRWSKAFELAQRDGDVFKLVEELI